MHIIQLRGCSFVRECTAYPAYRENTKGEVAVCSGSLRVQELWAGLGGMGALRLNRFLCNDGFKRAGKIMLWSGASTATGRWKRSRVAFPAETRLIAAATVLSRVVVSHWFFLMQVLIGSSASFKSNCVLSGGPSLESNTQHMCYALKTGSTALLGFILRRICL